MKAGDLWRARESLGPQGVAAEESSGDPGVHSLGSSQQDLLEQELPHPRTSNIAYCLLNEQANGQDRLFPVGILEILLWLQVFLPFLWK